MGELDQIEVQSLKNEILNLQTLRFTVLGLTTTALAAYLGWVTTATRVLSFPDTTIPALLVLLPAVMITVHFGHLISRGAAYLEVFCGSPWQRRLHVFRKVAEPMHMHHWLAFLYLTQGVAATLITFDMSEHSSTLPAIGLACVLAVLFLISLQRLTSVKDRIAADRESWLKVKARELQSLQSEAPAPELPQRAS